MTAGKRMGVIGGSSDANAILHAAVNYYRQKDLDV